jgi:hypothetical protein
MSEPRTRTKYIYDGNGLRVAKKSGATSCSSDTVTKLYWRSIAGDALAETDASGNTLNEYVFFGGRRIASRNGTGSVFYFFADQLGSTRTITDANGTASAPTLSGRLCVRLLFFPCFPRPSTFNFRSKIPTFSGLSTFLLP